VRIRMTDPTNAELAAKIDDINDRIRAQDGETARYHEEFRNRLNHIEDLFRTTSDKLLERIHNADIVGAVNTQGLVTANARMDAHDQYTREKEEAVTQTATTIEKATRARVNMVIAVLAVVATAAGVAVAIAVYLH
jgi:predicted nuclease with TOPRIM domain